MHCCVFVDHAVQSPSIICSVTARRPFKEGNIQSVYKYWKDACCLQTSENLSIELEVKHSVLGEVSYELGSCLSW